MIQKCGAGAKKLSRILVLLVLLISPGYAEAQTCYFTRQSVNMKIENRLLLVSGMYFVNSQDHQLSTVVFELPNGNNYGTVDSLSVFDVNSNKDIDSTLMEESHILFTLDFREKEEYLIQVHYRIPLEGNIAEYPFSSNTTTKNKLQQATFYLIAPTDMKVKNFTYNPTDTIDAGSNVVYYWEMLDFKPTGNFAFRFKNSK